MKNKQFKLMGTALGIIVIIVLIVFVLGGKKIGLGGEPGIQIGKSLADIQVGSYIEYNPKGLITVSGEESGTGGDQIFDASKYSHGWKVLSNKDGVIEIISAENVLTDSTGTSRKLTLGKAKRTMDGKEDNPEFDGSKTAYIKSVGILNKLCDEYATERIAKEGRCLGYEDGTLDLTTLGITISKISRAGVREAEQERGNYKDNYNRAEIELIYDNDVLHFDSDISGADRVWLPARDLSYESDHAGFSVHTCTSNGVATWQQEPLYWARSDLSCDSRSPSCGVRPVITLKSGLKLVGGDGKTVGTAYRLSL